MSGGEHVSLLQPRVSSAAPGSSSFAARWSIADWLLSLATFAVGMHLDGAPPFHRDIKPQLHDPSIAYPHTPAARQQVPAPLLWRICTTLPLVLLLPLALARARGVPSLRLLSELALGLTGSVGSALVLVCIVKNAVGRLRPDFLARCLPDAAGQCTGTDLKMITEGRKSFPSGHSALSFAALAYVALAYYARVLPVQTPRLGSIWKVVLPFLPWLIALEVALSRIQDYWHHWQDVCVGTLIGHVCAYASFRLRFPGPSNGRGLVPHVLAAEEELVASKSRPSPPEAI